MRPETRAIIEATANKKLQEAKDAEDRAATMEKEAAGLRRSATAARATAGEIGDLLKGR
jgi:hypothetical protein